MARTRQTKRRSRSRSQSASRSRSRSRSSGYRRQATKTCPRGKIWRPASTRTAYSYTRSDGRHVQVKSTHLPGKCIVNRGQTFANKLRESGRGTLGQYGYRQVKNKSVQERHAALQRAVKGLGARRVAELIQGAAVFSKNNSPDSTRAFNADLKWLAAHYPAARLPAMAPGRARSRSRSRSPSRSKSSSR